MSGMVNESAQHRRGITRRNFLQGACSMVILVGLGGLAEGLPSSASLLRPPGGQEQRWFESLCLRCDKCVEICPTSVVALARLEDGILQARTPIMNFHLGYCTFCNKCVDVCPTEALKPKDPGAYKIGVARVDMDNCIAWQWGGCTACKTSCKYNAIRFDSSNRPVIDEDKCNGCGQCEYVCPAAKLRSLKVGQSRGIIIVPHKTAEADIPASRGMI